MDRKRGARGAEAPHQDLPSCDSISPGLPPGEHSAKLIQMTSAVRRQYRRNAAPVDESALSDPYEMVLLAQHERRLGRYVYANALIEAAFLTYDARAAGDDARVTALVRRGDRR
jgi:hypothetical protein